MPIAVYRDEDPVGKPCVAQRAQKKNEVRPRSVELLAESIDFQVASLFGDGQQLLFYLLTASTAVKHRIDMRQEKPIGIRACAHQQVELLACSSAIMGCNGNASGFLDAGCGAKDFFLPIGKGSTFSGHFNDSCPNLCTVDASLTSFSIRSSICLSSSTSAIDLGF